MNKTLPYKDPEEGRAKQREYYLKNAEKIKARSSKRYEEKKDEISAKTKEDLDRANMLIKEAEDDAKASFIPFLKKQQFKISRFRRTKRRGII